MRQIAAISALLSASIASVGATASDSDYKSAYNSITEGELKAHVKEIASDKFMGRLPTGPGEKLTLDYLTKHFTEYGFKPGNGDSFFQKVDLVEITAEESQTLSIGGKDYKYRTDMVMGTSRTSELEQLKDSELVFVGYGINAPEYNWNDYEGLDMKGKTAVILVNDPGFASGDDSRFQGKTMTYYGRWTYKYEEASRQGAAGAIIIHETAPASYPWTVVENSWTGPQYGLVAGDNAPRRINVEGWIQANVAQELFTKAGLDFAETKRKANL
jgi:hypothetical protein